MGCSMTFHSSDPCSRSISSRKFSNEYPHTRKMTANPRVRNSLSIGSLLISLLVALHIAWSTPSLWTVLSMTFSRDQFKQQEKLIGEWTKTCPLSLRLDISPKTACAIGNHPRHSSVTFSKRALSGNNSNLAIHRSLFHVH